MPEAKEAFKEGLKTHYTRDLCDFLVSAARFNDDGGKGAVIELAAALKEAIENPSNNEEAMPDGVAKKAIVFVNRVIIGSQPTRESNGDEKLFQAARIIADTCLNNAREQSKAVVAVWEDYRDIFSERKGYCDLSDESFDRIAAASAAAPDPVARLQKILPVCVFVLEERDIIENWRAERVKGINFKLWPRKELN